MDKVRFAEHATAIGLPIPPTAVLRSRGGRRAAAADLTFPAVLKPSVKSDRLVRGHEGEGDPGSRPPTT